MSKQVSYNNERLDTDEVLAGSKYKVRANERRDTDEVIEENEQRRKPRVSQHFSATKPQEFISPRGSYAAPERRNTTVASSRSQVISGGQLGERKEKVKSIYDRKFTINHNNRVEPNFNSSSYQEHARASFKKRILYHICFLGIRPK